jgi:hypothetical protein
MDQKITTNSNNNLKFDELLKTNKDNNTVGKNHNESAINNESLSSEPTGKLQYFTE